jgi:hypothetical protein
MDVITIPAHAHESSVTELAQPEMGLAGIIPGAICAFVFFVGATCLSPDVRRRKKRTSSTPGEGFSVATLEGQLTEVMDHEG